MPVSSISSVQRRTSRAEVSEGGRHRFKTVPLARITGQGTEEQKRASQVLSQEGSDVGSDEGSRPRESEKAGSEAETFFLTRNQSMSGQREGVTWNWLLSSPGMG